MIKESVILIGLFGLLEQLREGVIDISAGQLSALITQGHDGFHLEKELITLDQARHLLNASLGRSSLII
ncbi:hypothetical protein [Nitrosomonas sp. Is37]|uniref:hypothetical protein n=1 Tax=Nitrosomonas sp. Is37 TaxID=3080535 RepID=UPI00294AE0C7|nr:hypothetical protein [Nitrosomonas sp. Is37]MDV6345106.1 hypothetical protein [Nitrosomonas sp. Is37]